MSNYKLEVENTEKLKEDINSAFAEINTELEKDDNLIASDLFDVDKKIEELKKSRKKWASGKVVPIAVKEGNYTFCIIKPNVPFKIKDIVITVKSMIYSTELYQTYTIVPYNLNCSTFSCIYISDDYTASSNNVRNFTKTGLTFIHYCNANAGDSTDTISRIQSELLENQFIIANGKENGVKSAISGGLLDVSFFATE